MFSVNSKYSFNLSKCPTELNLFRKINYGKKRNIERSLFEILELGLLTVW